MSERPLVTPETVVDRLDDDALHERIKMGRVTLAMIRPCVKESVNFSAASELNARDILESRIAQLGINMKFSMRLDEEAVTEFYADVIDRQLQKPAEVLSPMRSRWHEFQHLMTSGDSTIFLLESERFDAVARWRAQLGSWDIEGSRDPATLRGEFGIHNHNNLFHGSDSTRSVVNEVDIIKRCILRSKHATPTSYYALHAAQ